MDVQVNKMIDMGLVLEGGGMRCVYTSGVLEAFLENNLDFKYVIGVSAGAVVATSYISKQKGRNKIVTIDMIKDRRYLSLYNLIFKGAIFGFDFLFNQIPNKLVPFDYDSFYNSKTRYTLGVTNCVSGKAEYFQKKDLLDKKNLMKFLVTTSSIPFVSPVSRFNGNHYLDGGISDAVPLEKSIMDGNDKNVIILTRAKSYRKKKLGFGKLIGLKYRKYPELVSLLKDRHEKYNQKMDYIEKLEEEKKVFVIRPSESFSVNRLEKNTGKLTSLYNLGKKDGYSFIKKCQLF